MKVEVLKMTNGKCGKMWTEKERIMVLVIPFLLNYIHVDKPESHIKIFLKAMAELIWWKNIRIKAAFSLWNFLRSST